MSAPRLLPRGPVNDFSEALLAVELPGLPTQRRTEVAGFVVQRFAAMSSPMRAGVAVVAVATAAVGRVVGMRRVAAVLAARPLPVVGDYARLVRSLAHAYIWDRWPDTRADGAAT